MNSKQGTGIRLRGCCLAIGVALAAASPAHAATWDWGDWSGNWDNTVSYGVSWSAEDADRSLIGVPHGGTAPAQLTDDGKLNWEKGDIFSNIVKGTSEVGIDNGQFGAFGRIKYWYDFELEKGKVPHGHAPNGYQANAELDDSNFADYAKFSGVELLDAFVYGNFELGDSPLDLRIGRQVVNWGEAFFISGINVLNPVDVSAIRRPGVEIKEALLPVSLAYFNLGLPGEFSMEGFYQFKWEETVLDGCGTFFSTVDFAATGCNNLIIGNVLPDVIAQNILTVKKDPFVDQAKDEGQFGLALRRYFDGIDTEFGIYYQRIHSRTPVLNVRYNPAGAAPGGSNLSGTPVPVYYQVAYPENIDMYALSFATNVGPVAVQGEVSYKADMPVGVHGTTELTGALGVIQTGGQVCGLPDPNVAIGQFGQRACAAWGEFLTTGDGLAEGFDRFDVSQAQVSGLYFWDQGLGAERVTFIGEVAWIGTDGLPSTDVMPYGRNPVYGPPASVGGEDFGYITSSSWGYRLRAAADYSNVFAGVSLSPSIAWAHDVNGTSPTPFFVDGRKALSIALDANYLTRYRAGVSYTMFSGGRANVGIDRDFYSFTLSMDF